MNVGLIGLGNMGRGLGKNMLKNQIKLRVFDLNTTVVDELVTRGATASQSIVEQ